MRKMHMMSYSGMPGETIGVEDGHQGVQQNVRIQLPPQTLENGVVYSGEWLNGMKDGYGVQ